MIRFLSLCIVALFPLNQVTAQVSGSQWVYFGTYTGRGSEGIYVAELDLATGRLSEPKLAAKVTSPSFLALPSSRKYLYAVSEVSSIGGKKGGGVTAFKIDSGTGMLSTLNGELSGGAGPCHLSVDKTGQCVLVANYSGGSVASLPIREDGSLGEAVSIVKHTGKSVNKQRQEGPHAHSINVDAGNKFAFAADLGIDEIRIYEVDPRQGSITAHGSVKTPPGGGPRHFAFHSSGKFAYTNNEMTSSVTSFKYDADKGTLTVLDTVSSLPQDYTTPGNSTAEIKVHPTGKFLYVSNRGHNSIAVFKVHEDGSLAAQGHVSTEGKTPRNFNIDPTGQYLLAANQDSANVVVFKIDTTTGGLTPTGSSVKVSMPVCVLFLPK